MAVRNERVILSVQDNLSPGLARAAASAALLNRELRNLDGASIKADRSTQAFTRDLQSMDREAKGADRGINQLTGRLRLFADAAAIFGPGAVPVGGVLAAGVAGFASQLGFAAVAGGVLVGSMQGLGDALGAMNKAQLEPTTANLQKAKEALERLSPAAKDFAESAFALKPALVAMRDIGSEALFPGLTESLDNLERLGPKVAGIFQSVAAAAGEIAADSTASLASGRWDDFFTFIEAEAPDALKELATTVGDLTHGMAELWEAFTPLNDGFSSWLMGVADGFDQWATGLSATDGFAEFVDYIQTTGPQVADTLGALGGALVQIVQATAPLGGPVLAALEGFADAIAAIADSDLGTPIFAGIAALALLNRTLAVTAALSKTSLSTGMFAGLGTASKGIKGQAGSIKSDIAAMSDRLVVFGSNADKAGEAAERMKGRLATGAGLAGVAIAATGAADGLGLTNTATLALMGSFAGAPGIALGAAAGLLLDVKAASDSAADSMDAYRTSLEGMTRSQLDQVGATEKQRLIDEGFGGDRAKLDAIEAQIKATDELALSEKYAAIRAKGTALEFLAQTGANVDLAKWSGKSTEKIKAQADALVEAQKNADETARSFVGLGDSLNDGKVSLGQWIKEMASSADALNNFTNNSRTAAKRGLDDGLIASLQNAGEEGARRMRQLANGTEVEIGRANAAFRKGEKAIQRYNDYKVPPKKVTADTTRAMQSFREVDQYLSALDGKTATTYVNTISTLTRRATDGQGAAIFGQKADGGSVPKTGKPYADRHPYLLADGEEVISNRHGQADRHRSLLKSISAGRLADGGTTGDDPKRRKKITRSGGLFVVDNTDKLEQAIVRLTSVQEDQTKATERDIATRDEWAARMADVAQGTISGFSSGLFDKPSNPWAAGAAGGPLGNLKKDIAGLEARGGLQAQLAAAGLSGDALAAVLSEGTNADLQGILGSGTAGQVAASYAQRAALQAATGGQAGQLAFGSQSAAADKAAQAQVAELQQANIRLAGMEGRLAAMASALEAAANAPERTGHAVGKAVNGAVAGPVRNNPRPRVSRP